MTITKINQLKADRMKVVNEARALNDLAGKENRAFTADEQKRYDDLMKDVAARKATIEREEQLAGLEEEGRNTRGNTERPGVETRANEDEDGDGDEPEILTEVPPHLRALFGTALVPATQRSAFHFADRERRAAMRAFGKTQRANAAYAKAFGAYIRSGGRVTSGLIPAENRREERALQADNDVGGGYMLAPATMVADLIKDLDNQSHVRGLARKFVTGYQGLGAVSLNTDLDDFDWTVELGTGSEDDIELGKREMEPHPMAKRVKISKTLARNAPDVVSLINQRLAYKLGITQEKAYLTGSGAGQPLGVFTASSDGVPTTRDVSTDNTSTAITADGLKNAKFSLKAQHRARARWLFHRDAIKMVDKLKDGNGQYLWQPGLVAGQPDRLLNIPVDESEYAPNTFTTGLYVGILANWEYYWVLDSLDLAVQTLVELYAETNQNGLIARYEGDGAPVLAEAFVRVKLA